MMVHELITFLTIPLFSSFKQIIAGKMKYFLLLMTISGCSFEKTKNIIEIINEHEYEYYCGYNAAVLQFENEHSDLIVDLSNKKVLTYTASKDNNSYADGYHKALNIIVSRDNKHCPDPRSIK